MKFDAYNSIDTFLKYFRDKEDDLDEFDFQNLSLAHRQNADQALVIQLMQELGMSRKDANNLAHYSCKIICSYLTLLYLKTDNLKTYPGFYADGIKLKWFKSSEPGYMFVKTSELVGNFTVNGSSITVNEIDDYEEFINSDKPYYHVRIHVNDDGPGYDHSVMCYDCGNGKKLADVSYRKQGAPIDQFVTKNNFKYALWLN